MTHLTNNISSNPSDNFNHLVENNPRLFSGDFIKKTGSMWFDDNVSLINLDCSTITPTDRLLGANGVSTGFVLCMSGKTDQGETLRAICLTTHCVAFEAVFNRLKDQMLGNRCKRESLAAYVIGGQLPNPETEDEGTLLEEMEVLELAQRDPTIKEVLFNVTKGDGALSVVFTPVRIIVSTGELFRDTQPFGESFFVNNRFVSQAQPSSL